MKLIHADCFDLFPIIPSEFFDLIIIDSPYGKTHLNWDKPFDVKLMMDNLLRLIKPTGAILSFGREPMLSHQRIYAERHYRYDLIWRKTRKNGFLRAQQKPLEETEYIAVFSKSDVSKMTYNPFTKRPRDNVKQNKSRQQTQRGEFKSETFQSRGANYLTNIFEAGSTHKSGHPCEKPVELYEQLILTYSNIGQRVFDPCFGSGNSAIAAENLNRNYIGIEKDIQWFNNIIRE